MKVPVTKDDTTLTQYRNGHFVGYYQDGKPRFEKHGLVPDGSPAVKINEFTVIEVGICPGCGEKVSRGRSL